jgi:hypothetical protein
MSLLAPGALEKVLLETIFAVRRGHEKRRDPLDAAFSNRFEDWLRRQAAFLT